MSAGLRLTFAIAHRDGAKVLLRDSGPLHDMTAVREVLGTIGAAFERHSDLIVRLGERRFERERAPAPARQKRVAGRF